MSPSRPLSLLLAIGAACSVLGAQIPEDDIPRSQRFAAEAIREWLAEYEAGRLDPGGPLRSRVGLQPPYMRAARRGGFVFATDSDRMTHLDMLQKLLYFTEKHASPALVEVVLDVASTGIDASFLDPRSVELRELGHWTLMRVADQGTWFQILRAATGDRLPVFTELRPVSRRDEAVSEGARRQVAALRLLGQRALPVFRGAIESALVDADPRVRLAAAESIRPPFAAPTVDCVARAVERERHPVVSQALVKLLSQMLRQRPDGVDAASRRDHVARAIEQLGRCGWRTDMELLALVEKWPQKAAVPKLIEALDLSIRSPDQLVTAVNGQASPLLRERAGALLRAMTGALMPIDDPDAWREFWDRERDNLVVPEQLARPDPRGTRVEFFGVPVTGVSVAFLIDTSGSMEKAPSQNASITGLRRERVARTRLDAAKAQLALASQVMPEGSQFYLLTFADQARCWTPTPIKPGRGTSRALTGLLSRLNPKGGTNLYDGLVQALEIQGRRFGAVELPRIDELFVLSDGEPTTGEARDEATLLAMVAEANRYAKVRINTVFTGSGRGASLLQKLAEQNDGVFVQR